MEYIDKNRDKKTYQNLPIKRLKKKRLMEHCMTIFFKTSFEKDKSKTYTRKKQINKDYKSRAADVHLLHLSSIFMR